MGNRSVRYVVTTALVGVTAVALAIAFLRPTAEVSVYDGPVADIESATADTAVVTFRTEEGGFSLLGITFAAPTYRIGVSFNTPPDCMEVISQSTTWPTGNASCGPPGGFSGVPEVNGRTSTGDIVVTVIFETSKECFEAVAFGSIWNPDAPACA